VFHTHLRKARLAAGLSQERLAARARISREHLSHLERGLRQPTLPVFLRLCAAMNIYAPDFLKRIVPRPK
jgi:transcriptional regulator with XRE-family HTH domain